MMSVLATRCIAAASRSPWHAARVAQDAKKEIEKYQKMIGEGSPAELWELQGEALWKKKQGPKNASLEQCDLGLGPGKVKGAYAQLPRYFTDTDQVMDLEARLLHCMLTLQGRTQGRGHQAPLRQRRQALRDGVPGRPTSSGQSRGHKMAAGTSHPQEQESYALGKELFFYRAGRLGFLLRLLPRRGRQAHPHAGPAGAERGARRAEGVHHLARLSRLQQPAEDDAVAHQRLLPADALPRADLRLGGDVALTHYMAALGQGRALRRSRYQALRQGREQS